MATIVRVEKRCPKKHSDPAATITRTLSGSYAAEGWKGWRTIAKVAIAPRPDRPPLGSGLDVRTNTEYLRRGNVVLLLGETGSIKCNCGPKRDADRYLATKARLARLPRPSLASASGVTARLN